MLFYFFFPVRLAHSSYLLGSCVGVMQHQWSNVLLQKWTRCTWLRLPDSFEGKYNSPVFLCCIFFCLASKHFISITVVLSKCTVFILIHLWLPVQSVVLSWCHVYYLQLNNSLATKPVFPDETEEKPNTIISELCVCLDLTTILQIFVGILKFSYTGVDSMFAFSKVSFAHMLSEKRGA